MWQGLRLGSNNHILSLAYAKGIGELKAGSDSASGVQAIGTLESDRNLPQRPSSEICISQELSKIHPSPSFARDGSQVTWSDLFPYLRYQIVTCLDLTKLYQVNQEFAVRIKREGLEKQ